MSKIEKFCAAVITLICLSPLLTSCAEQHQAFESAKTVAIKNAQQFNDDAIDTLRVAICATPYSAIQRHPWLPAVIKAACEDSTTKAPDLLAQSTTSGATK